jgi:hypothetical protein
MPLHLLILGGGMLLFLIVVIGWGIKGIRSMLRREKKPLPARLAHLAGWLFGLIFLVMMVVLVLSFAVISPIYGIPDIYFTLPAWFNALMLAPRVLLLLGGLMSVLSVVLWVKRIWTLRGRVGYSLLSLDVLAILWALAYWNLLVI